MNTQNFFGKLLGKNSKKSVTKNFIIGLFSLFLLFIGISLFWLATIQIPSLDSLESWRMSESTKILDRTGKVLLYDVHENIKRTVIPLDQVSPNAQTATIAMEDSRFYQHFGIDPRAILRMIFVNLTDQGFSQGGSTITQQVVKNAFLSPEKTITRKVKEWIMAIKIERMLTKKQILELYFNEVPYGGNIYGIEEASKAFFGKKASELTLGEAAYLAALTPAPTYYSPYGNNKDKLIEREGLVLNRMLELKVITQEQYDAAKKEKITFLPQQDEGIEAPHFVVMVKQYLEEKYGKDVVENGGLRVTTTLDADLQSKAEEIVKKYGDSNATAYNASNAAAVGLDPKTGQVLAMVGSRDYFNKEIDGNFNVALSPHRQPGSSFKPFIYATAFMKGYTPDTVVFDVPTEFNTKCTVDGRPGSPDVKPGECYMPGNYDDTYRGPMTLRDALAQSVNVPAVKVFYLAGIQNSIETARKMGITTLKDAKQYGLTLVLGSGEVSLYEMTGAYGVFANNGLKNDNTFILKVEDAKGEVMEEYEQDQQDVLPKDIALKITDILADNVARAPLYDTNSPLYFPDRQVAVKTGTTNDYRDAWIIGYTPSFVLGVWAGNNDNSPMEKKISGFIVAPMWHDIMVEELAKIPTETFEKPEPTPTDIKPILRGDWKTGGVHSILYWVNKDDPLGPTPSNPANDPQYNLWEYPVRAWATGNGVGGISASATYAAPKTSEDTPKISLMSPFAGSTFNPAEKIPVNFQGSGKYPIIKAELYVNGTLLETRNSAPFSFSFYPGHVSNLQEDNTIKVVVSDSQGNTSQVSTTFKVNK